ncbi:MAG: tetratricopeptide repeat protein [Acidimicrobiia bacterium]|nr:tetratricopeptide repeat protein [Acidimicrobiia bacterium]
MARRGAENVDPEKRRQAPPPARGRGRGGQKPPPGGRQPAPSGRRQPPPSGRREPPKELGPPPAWEPEQWIEEPDAPAGGAAPRPLRKAATKAVARGGAATGRGATGRGGSATGRGGDRQRRTAPTDVVTEIGAAVPRTDAVRVQQRLMEAAKAFERERYKEADRMLKPLAEQAAAVPAVRELYGLNLYRLGRWKGAVKQLEAFRGQTGSVEQHPVLADSYRALGRHAKAEALWEELRTSDAHGELVTEGRIVAAGSLADRGDIGGAIRLLEKGPVHVKRPKPHHLRLWYALADLYERAGDTPRARELFGRIAAAEPDFADAADRLAAVD